MEAEGEVMSVEYTKKTFITDIFNGCFAVIIWISLISITHSFLKGVCLEIQISELWAFIPSIFLAYYYKKFSIWLVT